MIITSKIPGIDFSLRGRGKLTEEQKRQVIEIGKKVVSEIQIRELENIISVLGDDIFNDQQQKYYIIIDGLDEEWVDEQIKYKLIKSLIDSIRRFKKIPSVKIIIAMRQDLLDKVVKATRDQGFQEEKYLCVIDQIALDKKGPISRNLDNLYSPTRNYNSIRNFFFRELYITGLVGIKTSPSSTINWSHQDSRFLSPGQLKPNSDIFIHPMFFRTLNIKPI